MPLKFSVSVRDLVGFCLQEGSLKGGWGHSVDPAHAIFIHQTIQNTRPSEYEAEVWVDRVFTANDIELEILGRIDGMYTYPDRIVLEEIKTTMKDLKTIEEDENPLHWGQVKCYASLIAQKYEGRNFRMDLVYAHGVSGATRTFRQDLDTKDLEEFLDRLVLRYTAHLKARTEWWNDRNGSIRKLEFPFGEYRPGQEILVDETAQAVKEKYQLLVQAPTGIGKTMSVLFGALRELGGGSIDRIIYLTARNTGHNSARNALRILRESGLRLKSLVMTAKEKLCPCHELYCRPDDCRYAQGFFDRLRPAVGEAVQLDHIDEQDIRDLSDKYTICPFEFSLGLSEYMDCIVGDYNYVFDPRVSIKRLFVGPGKRSAALVDEAHNLVDRSRDMYSSELDRDRFVRALSVIPEKAPYVRTRTESVITWFGKTAAEVVESQMLVHEDSPEGISSCISSFIQAAHTYFVSEDPAAIPEVLQDVFWDCLGFLRTMGRFGDEYKTIYKPVSPDLSIRLFCIDPSPWLRETLEMLSSAVFISATLSPLEYFHKSFGCDPSARSFSLPSPFPSDNLCAAVLNRLSTLYRNRDATQKGVADALAAVVEARTGNYFFFFPSYAYMKQISSVFQKRNPHIRTAVQAPGLSAKQRNRFLELFKSGSASSFVGFAVMGGIFGEGIDLIGDKLIGAGIVSLGLPGLSAEREVIRQYYEDKWGEGYEYAFLYPGITRVLQAAGRVIRSETDRGVILLIDERFAMEKVADLLPDYWNVVNVHSREELVSELGEFWHIEKGNPESGNRK